MSLPGKPHIGGDGKGKTRCIFKTPVVEAVLEPWLTRHTPEAQAKSSNCRIQFSQNPVQLTPWIKCTEPRWWIPSHDGGYQATTVEYHEPRRWIPSHDGGVSWATTMDTEPRRWSIMSHDGGVSWATTVEYHEPRRWSIMGHDDGYRATTVEYHELRR